MNEGADIGCARIRALRELRVDLRVAYREVIGYNFVHSPPANRLVWPEGSVCPPPKPAVEHHWKPTP